MLLPKQQQRLIGSLLLLGVVAGIAFFLISNATEPVAQNSVSTIDTQQIGSEEEAVSEGDMDDVIDNVPETEAKSTQTELIDKRATISIEKRPSSEKNQKKTADNADVVEEIPVSVTPKPSWILQLASFSVADNAKKFQQKVSKLGYKATIVPVISSGKTIYRVRTDAIDNKQNAESLARKIQNSLGIKTQIIKSSQ